MKLPTFEDLGSRPTPNLGRTTATPDLTPIAKANQVFSQGLQNLGEGVYKANYAFNRAKKEEDLVSYNVAKSKFLQQTIALENELKNVENYEDIPTIYNEKFSQIRNDVLSSVKTPELRSTLQSEINLQSERSRIDVDNIFRAKKGDNDRALLSSTLDNNLKALLATSDEAKRREIIYSTNQLIDTLKKENSIDQEQAANISTKFAKEYAVNRINSMSEEQQIKAIGAKTDSKGNVIFKQTNSFADNLPADIKINIYKQAKSQLEAKQRESIRSEVNDINDAAKLGLSVPKENILNLASRASSIGMTNEARELRRYADVQEQAGVFAVQSINTQQQTLNNLKTGIEAGNVKDVDKYIAFSNILENKQKLLTTDPRKYYVSQGIINPTQDISLNNSAKIPDIIAQRRLDNEKVKLIEGNNFDLPLFTADEIKEIQDLYDNGDGERASTQISQIASGLRDDEKVAVAKLIFHSKQSSSSILATAFSLDAKKAKDIIIGSKIKGDITPEKVRQEANTYLQGRILNPEDSEVAQTAIYAQYKKIAFDKQDSSKEVNPDILEQSINDVLGNPIEISPKFMGASSKIFSFKDENGKQLDSGDIEDLFNSIDDNVLMKLKGGLPLLPSGDVISSKQMLEDVNFVNAGDGVYLPYREGVGYLIDKNGENYLIDLRQVKKQTGGVISNQNKSLFRNIIEKFNPISDAGAADFNFKNKEEAKQYVLNRYKNEFPYYDPSEEELNRFADKALMMKNGAK